MSSVYRSRNREVARAVCGHRDRNLPKKVREAQRQENRASLPLRAS